MNRSRPVSDALATSKMDANAYLFVSATSEYNVLIEVLLYQLGAHIGNVEQDLHSRCDTVSHAGVLVLVRPACMQQVLTCVSANAKP